METSNKQMVVATAPITTPTNQEQNSRNEIHVSNEIFQYESLRSNEHLSMLLEGNFLII